MSRGGLRRAGVWAIAAIAAMGLLASGCRPLLKADAASVPQLVSATLSDPKTFNYVFNNEYPNVFLYTYDGLVGSHGLTAETEPALAESWEISEDGKQIDFRLREGLRWSDGEPLTVEDVAFTYQDVYFNDAIPTSTRDVFRIGPQGLLPTVTVLDDRRVRFTLPEPFAPLLRSVTAPILPAHALRESVETLDSEGQPQFLSKWGIDTPPEEIVVNGPYKLAEYETSQRVIFERNPYYWRQEDPARSQPYIERFVWQIVESQDTALLQFRSGSLDLMAVTADYFSLLKREEERGNFEIQIAGPSSSTSLIGFNLNRGRRDGKPLVDPKKSEWFNTVEFRQAVAYAIDRQTIADTVFRGLGELQNSQISVQSPYYLSPEDGLPVYDYDPDRARELLESAGFRYAGDRLTDASGEPVEFTLITNAGNKTREAMGAQIKQDLSKIGIQVNFQPIAFNTLVDKLDNTLDWECFLLGFTGGVEPNNGFNIWSVDGRLHAFNQSPDPSQPPIEGREIADWEQRISDLYVRGAQETDEEARKAIYAETQKLVQTYLPFTYLVNPLSMGAIRDRLQGVELSALQGALWNLYELELADGPSADARTE